MLDPCLLGGVVRVAGGLPGLYALKGHAFLAEQDPKALVADVVDHPLGDQEVGQLGQTPGRERQAVLGRLGLGDLLDLPAFREAKGSRPTTLIFRVERLEAVGVEVVEHVPDPVRAGERHLGDLRYGHALCGQQHHLSPPPGHHRPLASADNPQQAPALIVINLPDLHTFGHPHSLTEITVRHVHASRPSAATNRSSTGR